VTAALTAPGHEGRTYEVTGPDLLTFADAAAQISAATGRELRFEKITANEYAEALTAHGIPGDAVGLLSYLFAEVLDGRNARLADGVQRALGRPPRRFADYARAAAAIGAWTPQLHADVR
jgi:uncharacterized protein YbjT (DUF2867 family)